MSFRRVFLLIASAALGFVLIAVLVRVSNLDIHITLHKLYRLSWATFARLVFLNGLLVYLSTEKWRRIDTALRESSDSIPSFAESFAHTSAGMALGLILPVQLGMAAARTLGTCVHGRALKRGTVGTIFEQSFDLLIVCFLAIASAVTRLCRGSGMMWTITAVSMVVFGLLVAGPAIKLSQWLADCAAAIVAPQKRVGSLLQSLSQLLHSNAMDVGSARRLVVLSTARFGVIVLMAGQTTEAIGAQIPLWHQAAAIPFIVISSLIAITPGGLGVNELTSATALGAFGTPLNIGAQWAIASRLLVTASCFIVAACSITVAAVERVLIPLVLKVKTRPEVGGV